jgi:hypothetical protein
MKCNNEKCMQYMICQTFGVIWIFTAFFWLAAPPMSPHSVAKQKTKI